MLLVNLSQLLLYPYHLAPVVPILFCLIAAGCRVAYQAALRLPGQKQYTLAASVTLAVLATTGVRLFADTLDIPPSSYWERGYEWQRDARADVVRWLNAKGGKHLVLVHYAPGHPVNQEWVYNGADIDSSTIIWAREVSRASDLALRKHYSNRQVWLVQADVFPQRVIEHPGFSKPDPEPPPCSSCTNALTLPSAHAVIAARQR